MAERKSYSNEEKVTIVKDYLLNGISSACIEEKYGVDRSMLCRWVKQLFESAEEMFNRKDKEKQNEKRIEKVEAKSEDYRHEIRLILVKLIEEKKASWCALDNYWVAMEIRDDVVDFIHWCLEHFDIPLYEILKMVGISPARFYDWRKRYGTDNAVREKPQRASKLEDAVVKIRVKYPHETLKDTTKRLKGMGFKVSQSLVWRIIQGVGARIYFNSLQFSN